MSRTRKPLSPSQQDMLRAINHPKSPTDILMALQVHYSPLNKYLDAVITSIEDKKIIRYIIDFCIKQHDKEISDQKRMELETQFLIKDMIEKKMVEQQEANRIAKQNAERPPERPLEAIKNQIAQLMQIMSAASVMFVACEMAEKWNTKSWSLASNVMQDQFTDTLTAKNISLVTADGNVIAADSKEAKVMFDQAFDRPAPAQTLRVLSDSMHVSETLDAIQATGSVPPAPPLPPTKEQLPPASVMAAKDSVNVMIRFLGLLSGEGGMLKALQANEKAFDTLADTLQNKVSITSPENQETVKVSRQSLFADAIDTQVKKNTIQAELTGAERELAKLQTQDQGNEYKSPTPFSMTPSPFKK